MTEGTIRYGVAGRTIPHTPRPYQASVTWVIEDMRVGEDATGRTLQSGTATPAAEPNVPITANAGPSEADPRRITCVTSNVVVGDHLEVLDDASGVVELVTVDSKGSTYFLTKVPLAGSYVGDAAQVRTVTVATAAIDAAIYNDQNRLRNGDPMRIVWTYDDGFKHQQQLRLIRHDFGDLDVAKVLEDVRKLFPDVHTRTEHHGRDTLEDHVAAVRDQLMARISRSKTDPRRYLVGDKGHWGHVWGVLRHLAYMGNMPGAAEDPQIWIDYVEREHQSAINDLLVGEGGPGTMETEPAQDTAIANEGNTYRQTIGPL